jgi:hypothetical protein
VIDLRRLARTAGLALVGAVLVSLAILAVQAWVAHRAGQVAELRRQKAQALHARDSLLVVVQVRDSITGAALELAARQHQAAQAKAVQAQQANHDAALQKARADSLGRVADSLGRAAEDAEAALAANAPGDTLSPPDWRAAYQSRTRQQMATAAALTAKTAESQAHEQAWHTEEARADGLAASLEASRGGAAKLGQALADSTYELGKARADLADRRCRVNLGLVKPSCGLVAALTFAGGVYAGIQVHR